MDLIPIPNGNTPPDIIGEGDDHFERIEASNVLEPGQFWRCAKECVIEGTDGFFRSNVTPNVGDIHLVTKLVEFEGTLHSVIILGHPRYASGDRFGKFTILAKDFFESFEKVTDEEAASQRAQEQAAVMDEVQSIQKEMLEAQVNPLQLPGVQEAAQNAVERFEREEAARVQSEVRNKEQRDADLRRIHRRAARRSEAKSNPIAVRKTTISDRLDVMISEGVTEDGVRELQIEAGRRLAIAQATAKWLQDRSKDMGEVLKQLTPYAAEQGQVALARASESIDLVNRVGRGIASLNLYTGTGVDVYQVREGADAPSSEPLTDEQILDGLSTIGVTVWGQRSEDFEAGARFAERMHGIGEKMP